MRSILITGASSGIGAKIAEQVAAPDVNLILVGRDADRLQAVASTCRGRRSTAEIVQLDLADAASVEDFARALDERDDIAAAYLAAGLSDIRPAGQASEPVELARSLGMVNFVAPTMLANALAGQMARHRRGRIVLIGSHAGFVPLPVSPSYCASKAGLARYARALRIGLMGHGVSVTLASPGYVDTPMSRRLLAPKPAMIDVDTAARRIVAAAERGKGHVVLSGWLLGVGYLYRLLPDRLCAMIGDRTRVNQMPWAP